MFAKLIAPAALGAVTVGLACGPGSTPADGGKCARGFSPIWPGACRNGSFPFVPP
jgi:hypothetical protein